MADSYVQVAPDSTGKKIENVQVTTSQGDVQRQVTVQGDPTNPSARVNVLNTDPAGTEYGTVVRLAGVVPLPSGSATAAKQDTGNTSVASVDTKIGEVQANPTANTVLGRLKDLLTGIVLSAGSALIGKVQIRNTANSADINPLTDTELRASVVPVSIRDASGQQLSFGAVGNMQVSPYILNAFGNLSSLNSAITTSLYGGTSATLLLGAPGPLSGTIVAEISFDFGSTWVGTTFILPTGAMAASIVNPATGALYEINVASATDVRVRVSAYTSGSMAASRIGTGFDCAIIDKYRPIMDADARRGVVEVSRLNGTLVDTNSGTKSAGTQRVVLATDQPALTTPMPVSNTNLDVALSTRLAEATFTTRINTLGQKTMAASTPVVLASDQAAVPVSNANLDVALSTRLAEATFTTRTNTLGQKVMAASMPVTLASDQSALPVTNTNLDVALSTRLAETTFTGRINTQGQKTMAASTPVVLASDQGVIGVTQGAFSSIAEGEQATTTPGTPVQLVAQAAKSVTIRAKENNEGVVVIGSAAIVPWPRCRRGLALWPGDEATLSVNDMSLLYMDASSYGDGIDWTAAA